MGGIAKAIGSIFGFNPKEVDVPDIPNPAAAIQDTPKDPNSPELGYTEGALAGKKKRGKSSLKIQKNVGATSSGANIT